MTTPKTPAKKTEGIPARGPGQPRKLTADAATLLRIKQLGKLNCTKLEAAAGMSVCEKTFYEFLKAHPEADEAFELGRSQGTLSLRRAMFKSAIAKGSDQMMIWLSKQHLGMKDKVEQAGDPNAPIMHRVEFIITDPAARPEAPAAGHEQD